MDTRPATIRDRIIIYECRNWFKLGFELKNFICCIAFRGNCSDWFWFSTKKNDRIVIRVWFVYGKSELIKVVLLILFRKHIHKMQRGGLWILEITWICYGILSICIIACKMMNSCNNKIKLLPVLTKKRMELIVKRSRRVCSWIKR